ncbi:unnamed protein product, partial [marine sediment metagenome]
IGVLRALGLRSGQIFTVFLAKTLLTGLVGACIGYAAGLAVALAWSPTLSPAEFFDPLLPVMLLLLAPVLSCLAGWVPAMSAARQDPAVILQEE